MEKSEQAILQKNLIQFMVGDVFNTIAEEDILKIVRSSSPTKADVWMYKGNALQQAQVEMLKSQAKNLKDSELWQIVKKELQWHAHEKGLVKSETAEDLLASKILLYLIDIIDSKLESMSR